MPSFHLFERRCLKFAHQAWTEVHGVVQTVIDLMQQVLRPLAERRGLTTWNKIVTFTQDEWFPSRLLFGKFKGRLDQEAAEDGELRSWIEWLAESTNEWSSAMGRWYLAQLAGVASLEDVTLIDLQVSQGENRAAAGLVVFQHPEAGLYQQLVTGRSSCACSTRISTG